MYDKRSALFDKLYIHSDMEVTDRAYLVNKVCRKIVTAAY